MNEDDGARSGRRAAGLVLCLLLPVLSACAPTGSPGARLYKRHCASCHGVDGGGGIQYQADEWASLIDDSWKYGFGDRPSIEQVLHEDLVFEHPTWELSSQEVRQLANHVLELRGESP